MNCIRRAYNSCGAAPARPHKPLFKVDAMRLYLKCRAESYSLEGQWQFTCKSAAKEMDDSVRLPAQGGSHRASYHLLVNVLLRSYDHSSTQLSFVQTEHEACEARRLLLIGPTCF